MREKAGESGGEESDAIQPTVELHTRQVNPHDWIYQDWTWNSLTWCEFLPLTKNDNLYRYLFCLENSDMWIHVESKCGVLYYGAE